MKVKKIEKLIDKEIEHQRNLLEKSPIPFTSEELKNEISEAEKETVSYTQNQVESLSWKK